MVPLKGTHVSDRVPSSHSSRSSSPSDGQSPLIGPSPALSSASDTDDAPEELEVPVSWMSMPNKSQLCVIIFARLAEPLSERSLTAYLFYQLRWFDSSLPDSTVARQAGILTSAFAAAQCLTSMAWGYAADHHRIGRKQVLIIGLLGTCISVLGIGFSTSYRSAIGFRLLAGALNGNIGVLRTMVSEVVVDKRYQSRAFLLLPICFSVGVIIGPIMGGFLADPINSVPWLFGPDSLLGGKNGVEWMTSYPYALPNIVCATILLFSLSVVVFGLDETHPALKHKRDYARNLTGIVACKFFKKQKGSAYAYEAVTTSPDLETETTPLIPHRREADETSEESATLKSLLKKSVILILAQHFLQAMHNSAFNAGVFIIFPATHSDNSNARLPFFFNGGLGLSTQEIGFANSCIGLVAITFQILVYPIISARFGVLPCYRFALPFSIVAYTVIPFLVLLPEGSAITWPFLIATMALHIFSRSFIGPGTIILVNDSAPHPSLLGTVHGLASSIASVARMLGPVISGAALAAGLRNNCVGIPFWGISFLAFINWLLLLRAKHETGVKSGR
uniref:Major facilitator superfamily (MFS) profile domain-containing protein n=2 Tax=Bionectria ochroleuca TaxID=29856 RepID=A0A0B7KGP9_BIOOC